MKALGDYLHSKSVKFGIYSSPGPKTCAGYEGGVNVQIATYTKMHEALHRTGRPIF